MALDTSSPIHEARNGSIGPLPTVSSFLKVETDVGTGGGVVNLVFDEESKEWKVFTLFTFLNELKGHEERTGEKRAYGYVFSKFLFVLWGYFGRVEALSEIAILTSAGMKLRRRVAVGARRERGRITLKMRNRLF